MGGRAERLWEVDAARGSAVVVMIAYHLFYDLDYFGAYPQDMLAGAWFVVNRVFASLFLLLVGVSLTLSRSRLDGSHFPKYLRRGLRVFGLGLLITATTYLVLDSGTIVFGVLHCIGLSIILAYPFIGRKNLSLVLGLVLIAAGFLVRNVRMDGYALVWLGVQPTVFYTLDYFPMLPWFGVVLVGVFAGHSLFPEGRRSIEVPDIAKNPAVRLTAYLGSRSLWVYLLHQPVLIGLLALSGVIDIGML